MSQPTQPPYGEKSAQSAQSAHSHGNKWNHSLFDCFSPFDTCTSPLPWSVYHLYDCGAADFSRFRELAVCPLTRLSRFFGLLLSLPAVREDTGTGEGRGRSIYVQCQRELSHPLAVPRVSTNTTRSAVDGTALNHSVIGLGSYSS
jgi:hypothetical protein